jgi:tetratricopeptide (TPR) repeat protein
MESLHLALRFNNEGVLLLLQNQDEFAMESLTRGLSLLKQALLIREQQCQSCQSDQDLQVCQDGILHHSTTALPGFDEDAKCLLYNNAVTFKVEETQHSLNQVHIYCAAIILNISLVYHRQGRIDCNKRDVCLAKAERTYESIAVLLRKENGGTALLLKVGALNNLANLRHEQGLYDDSQQGFQNLATLINGSGSEISSVLNSQTVRGLLLNVLLATPPSAAPAA